MTPIERVEQESRFKNRIIFSLLMAICLQAYGWMQTQQNIIVDLPPDTRNLTTTKAGDRSDNTIYGFAAIYHTQIHSFVNGSENRSNGFKSNVSRYRYYITNAYRAELLEQESQLRSIYQNRTKHVYMSSESTWNDDDIESDGDGWIVWLDLTIEESVTSAKSDKPLIKKHLRYPVRVIQDLTVSKYDNPWRLKLDGRGKREPRVIDDSKDNLKVVK